MTQPSFEATASRTFLRKSFLASEADKLSGTLDRGSPNGLEEEDEEMAAPIPAAGGMMGPAEAEAADAGASKPMGRISLHAKHS
mmetsp:Transcript_28018/g.65428  ORF Transcript_28018/g.65428 Transcript_28018/m.65428 type:complete len:84 (-) Transcript_28018:295-546(-)